MKTLVFAFQSAKIRTKMARVRLREPPLWGLESRPCHSRRALATTWVKSLTLVTPSEPVMLLLRNSLREITRFMHNVLEHRKWHPILFQQ